MLIEVRTPYHDSLINANDSLGMWSVFNDRLVHHCRLSHGRVLKKSRGKDGLEMYENRYAIAIPGEKTRNHM